MYRIDQLHFAWFHEHSYLLNWIWVLNDSEFVVAGYQMPYQSRTNKQGNTAPLAVEVFIYINPAQISQNYFYN